jgi:putative oxidoreductase
MTTQQTKKTIYTIFLIVVSLLFLQHGAQKLFGIFGGNKVDIFTLMGLAGIIEFFVPIFIILGLFTRVAASVASLEMIIAYFMAHASNFPPISQGGGELTLIYFISFLFIAIIGSGAWSLEKRIFGKEII